MSASQQEVAVAYAEQERVIALSRIRVGCLLAIVLLPAGALVDVFYYPNEVGKFLIVRFAGAGLMLLFWLLVMTPVGARHYRAAAVWLAMIPAASMAVIIALSKKTPPADSPYYAGLNLVLLAIGLVLQWDLRQSLVAVVLVIGMYVVAVLKTVPGNFGVFFNNLWFLFTTGIIVVIGNHLQARLRRQTFEASYFLEQSRKELELSNQRLRELDELKGRFFANISHELRTPLTVLLGHLETLRGHSAFADQSLSERLEAMHANGMRLLKLINDLLDLVRLDTGNLKLHCVWIDLEDFLRGLLNSVRHFAEDRGLKMECEVRSDLTSVHADPDKLEKVLLNLLFNAIKFTSAGGTVRLVAWLAGNEAVIEVSDSGAGIAPEDMPHLFRRFWQADTSAQRKFQGAGIGLALVKELVVAHGGTVEVRSQLGQGTTFSIHLPFVSPTQATSTPESDESHKPEAEEKEEAELVTASSPAASTKPDGRATWLASLYRRAELFSSLTPLRDTLRPWAPPGRTQRPRVLVADDEPDMLRFLKMQLAEDYDVTEAVDGEQVASLARQYLPEVIVCDMMMPERDGVQVCRELRESPATRAIPFLMLTARADDETKLAALAAGASDFLTKPFSLAELRVRLKNLVDIYQLQRTLTQQNRKLEATLEQLQETELQLVQTEKMASLGRMSAGIIHEINNPLNFARTGVYTLERFHGQMPSAQQEEYDETLRDIADGISRVAGIVSDLRIFTHPSAPGALEEVTVAQTATAALRFLAAEWKDKVCVENRIPEDFVVYAARSKLLQVLVNLLQNSLDALRSQTGRTETPTITLDAVEQEGQRLIKVRDNGPGISEHHLAKVFDPFFTTKDVGEGTGLGLSIVYRIVSECGGQVSVRSEVGQFCEFTLAFPVNLPETSPMS